MDLNRRTLLAAGTASTLIAPAGTRAETAHKPGRHVHAAVPVGPAPVTPLGDGPNTMAKWAFITDFNTGAELLSKEADAPMPPSSMTKLMTAYIVYEKLRAGELQMTQMLPVSDKAYEKGGSKMFVPKGGQVSVQDLILGMIVQSGNDACIVLAEGIAPDHQEETFVAMMNEKAKLFGLKVAHFRNCTGWPDPAQRMSCRDISIIARRLITDFPEYYKFDSIKSFTYDGITQANRNPLVQEDKADGLKTGHTDEGGYGLVASAQREGRRVIVVANGMTSMLQRRKESERLLEWAFSSFTDVTLFTAGDTVENAKVWLGNKPTVPLVGGRDIVLTVPTGDWKRTVKVTVKYTSPLPAPISRGDVLGTLSVTGGSMPPVELPLMAGADVEKLGLPGRAVAVVSRFVTGS